VSDDTLLGVWGSVVAVRRWKRRARAPRPADLGQPQTRCPSCGIPVVEGGSISLNLLAVFGSTPGSWFTDEELLDLCPLHQMLATAEVDGAGPA
jgi:hypothetical protein